jgi:hypothetical protein
LWARQQENGVQLLAGGTVQVERVLEVLKQGFVNIFVAGLVILGLGKQFLDQEIKVEGLPGVVLRPERKDIPEQEKEEKAGEEVTSLHGWPNR